MWNSLIYLGLRDKQPGILLNGAHHLPTWLPSECWLYCLTPRTDFLCFRKSVSYGFPNVKYFIFHSRNTIFKFWVSGAKLDQDSSFILGHHPLLKIINCRKKKTVTCQEACSSSVGLRVRQECWINNSIDAHHLFSALSHF